MCVIFHCCSLKLWSRIKLVLFNTIIQQTTIYIFKKYIYNSFQPTQSTVLDETPLSPQNDNDDDKNANEHTNKMYKIDIINIFYYSSTPLDSTATTTALFFTYFFMTFRANLL